MAFITSSSVSVQNDSKTVSVSGNVDLSSVDEGWAVQIGANKLVEASSGTAPNSSGVSTLTLFEPWQNGNVTAATMEIIPNSGYQIALAKRIKSIVDRTIDVMKLQHDYASELGQVIATDPDTNEQHVYNTLRQNQSEIDALLESFGTAAGYDVTESPQDIEIGKLVKVEERYFTTNFIVTLPENVTRRYMDVELPSTSRSLLIKVSAVAKQGQQLGTGGFEAVYVVERSSALSVNTLHCSEFTGSYRIGLAEPIIEGNVVHFGLRRGNNGTSTNANIHFKVDILCESRSDFNLSYSDGSVSHAYTNHSNKVLHTGNLVGTVSQSSSVPTGAAIERGSNANGEYTKFADGTMICSRTVVLQSGFPTSLDSKSVIDDSFVTPATFINTPSVHLTATALTTGNGGSARKAMSAWIRDQATSLVTTPYQFFSRHGVLMKLEERQFNEPDRAVLFFTAIGRWY